MTEIKSLLVIFGWIGLVLFASIILKKRFPANKELSRKVVHIGTGPIIPLAWWLEVSRELAIFCGILITIMLLINHRMRIINSIEDISRKSYGTIAYGISISILIILFWPSNNAAITSGILVMAFGDGFAGLIGRNFKSQNWNILGQQKSLAGTLTMTLVTCIVLVGIALTNGIPIDNLKIVLITCLAVGLEQISYMGIDNLTVPIGVSLGWIWMTT